MGSHVTYKNYTVQKLYKILKNGVIRNVLASDCVQVVYKTV